VAAAGAALPVGPDEASGLFRHLEAAPGLLLAVSGGPDSMALLALFSTWSRDAGASGARPALRAVTVDHGLRPESTAEAGLVSREAGRLGVPHVVLEWPGPKPGAGLQAAARAARYRLLCGEAARCGASHVVTAHHADDQAETVLMRLLRGSGLDGLAGMAALRDLGGVLLARPLLPVPKARLTATARATGMAFVEDPSNADPRFARTRMRRLTALLAEEGLTAGRLVMLAARAARAAEALDTAAARALAAFSRREDDRVRLERGLFSEPGEIVLRVLVSAVRDLGGVENDPIRLDRAERLAGDLTAKAREGRALRRTLAGCVVSMDGLGDVTITRETGRSRGSTLFTARKRRTDKV
jgi:tRNA(Ile)-lysidine synthase